jgi:ATP-dependent exoDNAse (exonuclease V) beta subunit
LLGFLGDSNRAVWQALTESLSPAILAAPLLASVDPIPTALPEVSLAGLDHAATRAKDIPRRLAPHALAQHGALDAEPALRHERDESTTQGPAANPGILYGTWWHEMVESIPWSQTPDLWQQKFLATLPASPQPDRAQREWELFSRSRLALWLSAPGKLIQVEIPFLCPGPDRTVVEGVIDLAVFSPDESLWRVVDWKTNYLGPQGSAPLVDLYRSQVHAYVRVLRQILSAPVTGSLYFTQTAGWIDID